MKLEKSTGLSFFRILFPGFSEKLPMPHAFVKHIAEKKKRKRATIVSPNGKAWNVEIYKDDKSIYLGGEGWREIVQTYKLEIGYFLVFHYIGDMEFSFKVYDLSTCEKDYSVEFKRSKTKKSHSQDEKSNLGKEPTEGSCEEMTVKYSKPLLSSKKRMAAGPTNVSKAKKYCSRWEVTIKPYNVSAGFMLIPVEIRESCGLPYKSTEVILRNPEGRSWPVRLKCHTGLSAGWTAFARENNLKEGDKCIFELGSGGKSQIMDVSILRC